MSTWYCVFCKTSHSNAPIVYQCMEGRKVKYIKSCQPLCADYFTKYRCNECLRKCSDFRKTTFIKYSAGDKITYYVYCSYVCEEKQHEQFLAISARICPGCNGPVDNPVVCSLCQVNYCSVDCRKQNWETHRLCCLDEFMTRNLCSTGKWNCRLCNTQHSSTKVTHIVRREGDTGYANLCRVTSLASDCYICEAPSTPLYHFTLPRRGDVVFWLALCSNECRKIVTAEFGSLEKACCYCRKFRTFKLCGRCKKVGYCSRECQKADWTSHKLTCV